MSRRISALLLAGILCLAALTTGLPYLWFLVYLAIIAFGAAYLVARRGLADLEAGSWLDRQHATVGEVLTITYTVRNLSRLPKPWLETHSPSTLPVSIPGRVIALGPRRARSWAARVPLVRRGQFRIDPMVVRTGDPFGLFESVASVGPGATVLVYPRLENLPGWHLPPLPIEGSSSDRERSQQQAPLATGVRPYTPGDAFNRIHWRSSARHQELQVKEFEIERTSDAWIFLDLERSPHVGEGEDATIETCVRACAAIATEAIGDGRGVGFEAYGMRRVLLPVDRGSRQRQKIMGLLAVAQPDGVVPLGELLTEALPRLRQGTVAIVVTASVDRDWVRPLAGLRSRGVTAVACVADPLAHEEARHQVSGWPPLDPAETEPLRRNIAALRHALEEHGVQVTFLSPGRPLAEQMVGGGRLVLDAARR